MEKIVRRKKCSGGLPACKNIVGNYKDVDGVGCCEQCDKYVDDNPYDPYWEQMDIAFSDSKEYEELEKQGLVEDSDAYEKAFEKYQEEYQRLKPWPIMRRQMANSEGRAKARTTGMCHAS